jgi:hypothetical protein
MGLSEQLFNRELSRTRDLVQSPDWYMDYGRTQKVRALGLGALQAAGSGSIAEARHFAKQQQLETFRRLLSENAVRIGDPDKDELENWDEERAPIDRFVIHHSSRAEGLSLEQLNAMHFLRLYLPRYQQGDLKTSQDKLQPIYSAHFDETGRQVFYGYHWKVERDGEVKRLLSDTAVGWHAGNWEVNKQSIGIVIDDDLTDKSPTPESLEAVADILTRHYGTVDFSPTTILGHRAISHTICPGSTFEDGWKKDLLDKLEA